MCVHACMYTHKKTNKKGKFKTQQQQQSPTLRKCKEHVLIKQIGENSKVSNKHKKNDVEEKQNLKIRRCYK